jgi:hypothetical protein
LLQLYDHGSSVCAAKVRLALAEKQLRWRSRYVDILAGEQFRPEHLAVNPKAVVPVLDHEGAAAAPPGPRHKDDAPSSAARAMFNSMHPECRPEAGDGERSLGIPARGVDSVSA